MGLRFLLHPLFIDTMNYWGIGLGQLTLNGIRQIVVFILICKVFRILMNLEAFRNIFFYIKQVKEGPGCHTFQKKNVVENFIIKLPQTISS